MNRSQRIAILVAGVVAVAVAFVVLSPGDDSTDTNTTTTTAATTPATTDTAPTTPTTPAPAPSIPLLTKGKVREIKVSKGEIVRFRVRSSTPEEVHVHGYDIKSEVPAGGTTRLAFTAKIEGIFEIEFEDSHTQIGKLVVEP